MIYAKDGAGEWALNKLPICYQAIVRDAIDVYRSKQLSLSYGQFELDGLRQYVRQHIHQE